MRNVRRIPGLLAVPAVVVAVLAVPAVLAVLAVLAGTPPLLRPAGAGAAPAPPLSPPGCTAATAPGPALAVTPRFAAMPGLPFDAETTRDSRFTFVSSQGVGQANHTGGGAILVYRGDGCGGGALHTLLLGNVAPSGMALTDGGRMLLVAANTALVVVDVRAAERGAAGAVAWEVHAPGSGAIEVTPTRDGRFAFVTMEDSDTVDVFRLSGHGSPRSIGSVPVGVAPVGVAVSPDDRTAYVTSEVARHGSPNGPGTLSLLRVAVAEHHPADAVGRTVDAGCSPVRVVIAANGTTVWVSARGSDAVLGFSARALAAGTPALESDLVVGTAPVGLALFDGGRRLLVADSNRFGAGPASTLAVVDLAGPPTLVGYVPAGAFPRQMTLEPGGRELDVTNYQSSQLETVPVAPLVAAAP